MYGRVSSKGKDEGVSDGSRVFRHLNIVPRDDDLVPKFGGKFEDWIDIEGSAKCRLAII